MSKRQRHATDESGDCAHWCRACDNNIKAGLNPDGTERVCHCGNGFYDHHDPSHAFVEYNASSLECPRVVQAVERVVAAERAAIRDALLARADEERAAGDPEGAAALQSFAEWLDARSKEGAR